MKTACAEVHWELIKYSLIEWSTVFYRWLVIVVSKAGSFQRGILEWNMVRVTLMVSFTRLLGRNVAKLTDLSSWRLFLSTYPGQRETISHCVTNIYPLLQLPPLFWPWQININISLMRKISVNLKYVFTYISAGFLLLYLMLHQFWLSNVLTVKLVIILWTKKENTNLNYC